MPKRKIDREITLEELGDEIQRRNDASRTRFFYYQEDQEMEEGLLYTNLVDEEDLGDMLEFYEEHVKEYFTYDDGDDEE